jgi:hypothetical protein
VDALLVERHVVGELELPARQLLDVDVLERQDPHARDEPVGAVDVPHPHIAHGELEIEVVLGVVPNDIDLVREIEPALRLDDVLKLTDDVAILAVQRELQLAIEFLESILIHGRPILRGRTWFQKSGCAGAIAHDCR